MRFMMLVKAGADYEAGKPPAPELVAAIGQLAEEMTRAGVLLDTGGLQPSVKGAKVRVGGGNLSVIDGPFAGAKELVGGYAIVQARSRDEAIEMGRRFMKVHADVLGPSYQGEVEIRPLFEAADLGPDHF